MEEESTPIDHPPRQPLDLRIRLLLLLSAAAAAVAVWMIVGSSRVPISREELRRSGVAYGAVVILLSILLVWLTRSGGSWALRSVLSGLLSGLSGTICIFFALAAFDVWWGPQETLMAIAAPLTLLAPVGGLLGLVVGVIRGSVALRRGRRQVAGIADSADGKSDPQRPTGAGAGRSCQWTARLNSAASILWLVSTAIMLLACAALVGSYCLKDPDAQRAIYVHKEWSVAIMIAVPALAALLVCLIKAGGRDVPRSPGTGLLVGLALLMHGGAGLALFDGILSGRPQVALRMVPAVILMVPWAAALGGGLGLLVGAFLSLADRLAARIAAKKAAAGRDPGTAPVKSRLARLMLWVLAAVVALALYSPVSYELTRRRAVWAIEAAGGRVAFGSRRPAWLQAGSFGSVVDELLPWLDPRWECAFYSRPYANQVQLGPGAGDEQLAWVLEFPEINCLSLKDPTITDAGFARVNAELSLSRLFVRQSRASDDTLRGVASMPPVAVSFLDLSGAPITDESLRHLAGAMSLANLNLSQTPITGEGLRYLAGLPWLVELDLRDTHITDDSLQHLAKIPGLTRLNLRNTAIDGSGLKHLKPLRLVWLDLSHTELKGPGLGQLAGQTALWDLNLTGSRLDEAAFQQISRLGKLRFVNLNETNVTDDWLRHLAGMKSATLTLGLYDTAVSEEGLRNLQQSLPRSFGGRRPLSSLPAASGR